MKQAKFTVENSNGKKCKVTVKCIGYIDSEKDGCTGFEDRILGWGRFTMKAEHRQPMIDFYGGDMPDVFDMENDWKEGQDCETNNSDQFIFYANFLINTKREVEIRVYAEHIFWFIHDFYHAENDVHGNTMECGPYQELERFQQAYETLKKNKLGMRPEYVQRIVTAFNERKWGCYSAWEYMRDRITADSIKERN